MHNSALQGHDTTAAGSSFVMCLLGIYQNIQDKVYDELYQIFGDSDRPATFDDTLQMKYLERVILETLRLYPPVPIIARELKHDAQIGKDLLSFYDILHLIYYLSRRTSILHCHIAVIDSVIVLTSEYFF